MNTDKFATPYVKVFYSDILDGAKIRAVAVVDDEGMTEIPAIEIEVHTPSEKLPSLKLTFHAADFKLVQLSEEEFDKQSKELRPHTNGLACNNNLFRKIDGRAADDQRIITTDTSS